jgi:hypothetical protein
MATGNRFNADQGGRGGSSSDFSANAPETRGGNGADGQDTVDSSAMPSNVHSSSGFRRALERSSRSGGNKLVGAITSKTNFGGKGFRKPNYFAQGGQRHGMHMGSGAPAINPAESTGSGFGGN